VCKKGILWVAWQQQLIQWLWSCLKVVVSLMRWLFCEATTSFSLPLSLLHIIENLTWDCMGWPMRPLTCTNVLAPNTSTQTLPLWAPPKDWAPNRSRDSKSHRWHPIVDGNTSYHLTVICWVCLAQPKTSQGHALLVSLVLHASRGAAQNHKTTTSNFFYLFDTIVEK
jgi:hypothetical protein